MTPLFTTYLRDLMARGEISIDELRKELDYARATFIHIWLQGQGRPSIDQLPRLAKIFHADLVEMSLGWLIDQNPELEGVLWKEVLGPRGSKFPKSTDITLRAPSPPRGGTVMDPCDENRS